MLDTRVVKLIWLQLSYLCLDRFTLKTMLPVTLFISDFSFFFCHWHIVQYPEHFYP